MFNALMTPGRVTAGVLPLGLPVTAAKLRVFESATVLFGDRGYHGVSMRDLAEHLGIAAPSLYKHVASKQQLLFELLDIGMTEYHARLRKAHDEAGDDAAAQLSALVRAHVLLRLRYPEVSRVCTSELRHLEDAHRAPVLDTLHRGAQLFLDAVMRGVDDGTFSVEDPHGAMRAIADMSNGTAEWPAPAGPENAIADRYVTYALRVLGHS